MLSSQRILVTGGTGYIGSHTVVDLIQKGFQVVIIDNLYNSSVKVLENIKKIVGQPELDLGFENVDLRDEKEVERVFRERGPFDAVIHFAALKAVGESVKKPLAYDKNNVCGAINLLESMSKHACNCFVFSSSACVYGENPRAQEHHAIQPINPYGHTKSITEQIIKDVAAATPGFTAISLRYFNPIGAHPTGLLGESPLDIPNNLMPYLQKVVTGELPHLNVFGTDYDTEDGSGVRDFIHVCDLAKGHSAALAKSDLHGFHAFNLGTGKGTSVLQLAAAMEKASGKELKKVFAPRREGDAAISMCDPSKAREVLGWQTELSIEQACLDSCKWVENYPRGLE